MHRRGLSRIVVSLFAATALSMPVSASVSASASHAPSAVVLSPDDVPTPTVSDFFPEESNLSDCIGLVERPGCGSESRGGWRQTAVLGAILLGLAVVFGNVIRGVRKNRAAIDAAADNSSPSAS